MLNKTQISWLYTLKIPTGYSKQKVEIGIGSGEPLIKLVTPKSYSSYSYLRQSFLILHRIPGSSKTFELSEIGSLDSN